MPAELPNAGTYRGSDGFMTWLDQWLEAWEDFSVEIGRRRARGRRPRGRDMHQSARGKGSGIPVEMDDLLPVGRREGRLAAMHLYATRERGAAGGRAERERATGD